MFIVYLPLGTGMVGLGALGLCLILVYGVWFYFVFFVDNNFHHLIRISSSIRFYIRF